MRDYVDVNVSTWSLMRVEPMGSKPDKLWLRDPDSHDDGPVSWLFKPRGIQREEDRQFPRGEDWAEKIVAALAVELAIPAAGVELAHRDDQLGIISRNVVEGRALVLGNEVLAGADPDYDPDRQRAVPGYAVEAVVAALEALGATAPITSPGIDAASIFAGYLVLDALVANMDRHHENWGVLIDQWGIAPPVLSPTFDHASSLGFQLSDEERTERLDTADGNRTIDRYAERGQSRHFAGSPGLVNLAQDALGRFCTGSCRDGYLRRLEALDDQALWSIVDAVPDGRMSLPARRFCARLMGINRRRLLDGIERSR